MNPKSYSSFISFIRNKINETTWVHNKKLAYVRRHNVNTSISINQWTRPTTKRSAATPSFYKDKQRFISSRCHNKSSVRARVNRG